MSPFRLAVFPVVLAFACPSVAFAYLDPGTGSIIFQGIVAGIAAALATGKFWWHRVKSIFTRSPDEQSEALTETEDNQQQ
ncbi:MAG: hypothetical protein AAF402_03735 [Pseudomonadota bacterium]